MTFTRSSCKTAAAGLFLSAVLLAHPLVWLRIFGRGAADWEVFTLFSPAALSLLACGLGAFELGFSGGFWKRGGRAAALPIVGALLFAYGVCIRQIGGVDSFRLVMAALFPVTLTFFAVAYAAELRRLLPGFLLLLLLLSLCQYGNAALRGMGVGGLTGNWNWSAALLAICAPAAAWFATRRRRDETALAAMAAAALGGVLLATLFSYSSKGVFAALAGALAVTALLRRRARLSRRRVLAALAAAVLLTAAGVSFFSDRLAGFLAEDVRLTLWRGGWELFCENPWRGCGAGVYAGAVAPHLPPDYWMTAFPADLHPHPHNEILFYLGSYGVWALPLLLGAAMMLCRIGREKMTAVAEPADCWFFGALLLILLHAMVDMPLAAWPLDAISFLLLGMLWRETFPEPPERRPAGRLVCGFLGGLLLIGAVLAAVVSAGGSRQLRQARRAVAAGDDTAALANYELVRLLLPEEPEAYYLPAQLELFRRKNPDAALEFLRLMPRKTGFRHYLHCHALAGRALALRGRPAEALAEFEEEQRLFPLSTLNLLRLQHLLRSLGRDADAKAIQERLEENLTLKGLTPADLPFLLRHEKYDILFREYLRLRNKK